MVFSPGESHVRLTLTNTTLTLFLPNTRITELHSLLLDDLPHGVVVDVLLEAVLDVELLGEEWNTGLVSQHVRYGEVRLVMLTKLRPVLTDLVSVVKNLPKQESPSSSSSH